MNTISNDEFLDTNEAYRELKKFMEPMHDKYSHAALGTAISMIWVDCHYAFAKDKEHFLESKRIICDLIDLDAVRFYG
jgi:hypothetical protein